MHTSLALLCVSVVALASVCFSRPAKGESNSIHGIINIVQTTLVHIQKVKAKWPVASTIAVVISPPSIEGLRSISHDLGLLDFQLQNPSSHILTQIQTDVSSLWGRVRSHSQTMECPVQDRPGGRNATEDAFPATEQYQRLIKVQNYLDHLIRNQDKLNIC